MPDPATTYPAMSQPIIEVRNITKRYQLGEFGASSLRDEIESFWKKLRGQHKTTQKNEFWALRDLSFTVNQGDIIGIIGRNGAGKSTLLKIISRITEPTSGEIRLRGRVASLLEVGTGFHPELTARENIYLNGTILGMRKSEIDRKLDEIVDFAGVEQFLDTPVKRFSSGMNVRLGFAVAAHLEPEILIVDEVLAVGDAAFQTKCLGKMKNVASHGRTVLFVSHNLTSIRNLCQRCIVLADGQTFYEGNTEDAIAAYRLSCANHNHPDNRLPSRHIIAVECTTTDGTPSDVFHPGDTIDIHLRLKLGETILRSPRIGIGVENDLGERLFTVGTYFSSSQLPALKGTVNLRCRMHDVRAAPGAYFAKIAIADDTHQIDSVENLPLFTLDNSDYYGTGRLPTRSQGSLLQKSEWSTHS